MVRRKRENVNILCKTFPYYTGGRICHRNSFFICVEKWLCHKNAFWTLFSYYICLYICIYMCAYVFLNVYNISMVVNICIIMFYLLFGIEMTMLSCFLPMIWFNNTYIDCICNQSHCKVSVPLYDCVITRYLEWSFLDIYIYIYVLKRKEPRCVHLFCSVFMERKDLVMKHLPFYWFLFQFPFGSDMVLSCTPFIV